jgi:cell division protein FtsQ
MAVAPRLASATSPRSGLAAPAADKRFRRAHVSPARRRTWRERLPTIARVTIALAVVGALAYRAADLFLSSEAMTITRLTVSGNSRMSKGEVLALLEGVRGSNMLTVDLDGWRRRLMDSPWVADAEIRRGFPGTLAVRVLERQPLGIARINDSLYLVDQRATVIDEFGPNYAELDLPVIDGLAASAKGGLMVDEPRAALAARLLADLQRRPDLARRVSQIDVADVHDAVVILKSDSTLVRIGDERFAERIQTYVDLAPALRERVPEIDYVDLRFDERVYVKPVGAARVQKAKS